MLCSVVEKRSHNENACWLGCWDDGVAVVVVVTVLMSLWRALCTVRTKVAVVLSKSWDKKKRERYAPKRSRRSAHDAIFPRLFSRYRIVIIFVAAIFCL